MPCSFGPPYLLRRLARNVVLGRVSTVGEHTLELDRVLRARREDLPSTPVSPAAGAERAAAATATRLVRRSGGFGGVVRGGELDLETDPEGPEVRLLLSHLQGDPIAVGPATPDRFTYTVRYGTWQLSVSEPDLTPELRRVVSIVLSRDRPPRLGH